MCYEHVFSHTHTHTHGYLMIV